MLLVDDIALVDETTDQVDDTLERWRLTLESQGSRLNWSKMESTKYNFGNEGE